MYIIYYLLLLVPYFSSLNIRLVSGQTVSRCWSWVSIETQIELIMYDLYVHEPAACQAALQLCMCIDIISSYSVHSYCITQLRHWPLSYTGQQYYNTPIMDLS